MPIRKAHFRPSEFNLPCRRHILHHKLVVEHQPPPWGKLNARKKNTHKQQPAVVPSQQWDGPTLPTLSSPGASSNASFLPGWALSCAAAQSTFTQEPISANQTSYALQDAVNPPWTSSMPRGDWDGRSCPPLHLPRHSVQRRLSAKPQKTQHTLPQKGYMIKNITTILLE